MRRVTTPAEKVGEATAEAVPVVAVQAAHATLVLSATTERPPGTTTDVRAPGSGSFEVDFEISQDAEDVTAEQIAALYESVGYGSASDYLERPRFKQRLTGPGVHCFFALDTNTRDLIGILRAFSDELIVAWIAEVCVQPSHQRKGVGSALVLSCSREFSSLALYADSFAHTIDFFRDCGLRSKTILVACSRAPFRRELSS